MNKLSPINRCLLSFVLTASLAVEHSAGKEAALREQVAPILQRRCIGCHNGREPKGDLSLETWETIERSGVILPGNPAASPLLAMISRQGDAQPEMPKDADPLTEVEVAAIRDWIASGARWPPGFALKSPAVTDTDWWSLLPLQQPDVPQFDDAADWIRSPIDAFVLRKLREKGLAPSTAADRRSLIRRLYYDLIGLPPTPSAVEAFLADANPQAYEALVDRLLASPHYGERWARHWLDIVHYGDTHGYDKDKLRPNAWPYRDYVIRAWNDDTPYGRFVQEQLAGDVLFPGEPQLIAATGFIAAGPWDFIGHVEVPGTKIDGRVARNLDRDDMVVNTIHTFCSVTVGCARCHNHKFDPITQEDYYSLQAVFAAIGRYDRPFDADRETAARRATLEKRQAKLVAKRATLQSESAPLAGSLASGGPAPGDPALSQPELSELELGKPELGEPELTEPELSEIETRLRRIEKRLAQLPKPQLVYAAATHFEPEGGHEPSRGKPLPIFVLQRGMIDQHLQPVGPGTLRLPGDLPSRFTLPPVATEGDRRVALANWIVDRRNPLTWRSIVNRIWQFHFGRGIVGSPNDLGRMGQLPSHPELLDWLATEFRDGGDSIAQPQSLKALHRLLVTSSTYRQAVSHNEAYARIDSGNQYYWRASRRRLEAEAIRDSVLLVAGKLKQQMFGPGFQDFVLEQTAHSPQFIYDKHDPDDPATHRRSIYRFLPRSQPQPFMETLDCADPSQQVAKRDETLTPLSALALLNNRFMIRMAEHFAERLEAASRDRDQQFELAFRLALSRPPQAEERRAMIAYADAQGLPSACRVLLNLNEFVFVD